MYVFHAKFEKPIASGNKINKFNYSICLIFSINIKVGLCSRKILQTNCILTEIAVSTIAKFTLHAKLVHLKSIEMKKIFSNKEDKEFFAIVKKDFGKELFKSKSFSMKTNLPYREKYYFHLMF